MSAQIHSGRSPPKRQRLCSESVLATSSNGARVREDSTSRFFAPSPSLRKASSKKDEFELWSDESAHDAVAALADTPAHSPSPKKRKRLSIFSDASPADLRRLLESGEALDAARWATIREMGLLGICAPESAGGLGLEGLKAGRRLMGARWKGASASFGMSHVDFPQRFR